MKTIFLSLLFLYSATSYAQIYNSVQLLIEDATGQKDTIYYGAILPWSDTATMDIDSVLGERDIYGQPYSSLDARVMQRDSNNHHCIRKQHSTSPPSPNLYFPHNLDSKIDYRPFLGDNNSIYNNFEIQIQAQNYPVTVRVGEVNSMAGLYLFSFNMLDSACDLQSSISFTSGPIQADTLFVLQNPTENTIVARIEMVVSTDRVKGNKTQIQVFPNPAHQQLFVAGNPLNGEVEVINTIGQVLIKQTVIGNKALIGIQKLNKGVYFLRYYNSRTKESHLQKFIKQ